VLQFSARKLEISTSLIFDYVSVRDEAPNVKTVAMTCCPVRAITEDGGMKTSREKPKTPREKSTLVSPAPP
jgi:predicted transcriptional regulator